MKIRCSNPWSWYPVIASGDLAPGGVMPALLLGERLVVWRSDTGQIGVWNDRCPHRGMRLSMGAIRAGSLICPYHGWEFDAEGACSHIPAHPDLSPSRAARARLYPAVETGGYVWACIGEPATAQPGYRLVPGQQVRTMHLACDAETLCLALLARPLAGAASATLDWDAQIVTAGSTQLEFPGLLVGAGYAALVQPTGDDSAAVHLSVTAPGAGLAERQALNQALVQFRRDLPTLLDSPALDAIRAQTAGIADLQPGD
jgi:nitrite reductase/ring-hydroxylating ferredoxin subunit